MLLSESAERVAQAAAGPDAPTRFNTDLANGLHAMAQPLTVLRGALGALAMRNGVTPECGRYLEMSTTQVERLCGLLANLQMRLDAERAELKFTSINLFELVASSLQDLGGSLDGLTVELSEAPDSALLITGDRQRTEQAFQAVMNAVAAASEAGGAIQLSMVSRHQIVELIVQHASQNGKSLSSSDRLGLSVAEANMRAQQGGYACKEDPLRVSLAWPAHSREVGASRGEVPFDGNT